MLASTALGVGFVVTTAADSMFLMEVYASTRWDELAPTGWSDTMKHGFLAQQFAAQHRHYQQHYPSALFLRIERSGRLVGRLYLDEWPEEIRLVDIALLPNARGGGVGDAILTDLSTYADAIEKTLSLHVERHNSARRLYLRHGFVMVGEAGVYDLLRRPLSA